MDGYGHIFTFKNKNTLDIWLNESSVLCSRNFRSLQMSSRGLMIHLSSNCRTTALKTKNDIYVSTKLIPRIYSEALPEASLFCVALKKKKKRERNQPLHVNDLISDLDSMWGRKRRLSCKDAQDLSGSRTTLISAPWRYLSSDGQLGSGDFQITSSEK